MAVTVHDILIIGFHAVLVRFLDATARRRVVTGYRQADIGSVRKPEGPLNQPLAKGSPPHYDSSVPILQSPGKNLGSRCRTLVHHHHYTAFGKETVLGGIKRLLGLRLAFHIDNQLVLGQKFISQIHRHIQIATRIAPQIQNQILHPLRLQFLQSSAHLLHAGTGKARQHDVSVFLVNHEIGIDAVERYLVSDYLEMQYLRLALTFDAHIHLGAFLASQMLEHEISRSVLAGCVHRVYRHDFVPGQQAHLGRRAVGYHLDNHDAVVVGLERDPDAVEVAHQGLVHLLQVLGRDIGRMGIQFL